MGVAAMQVPKGLGLFGLGHLLSQNRVPKLSDPGPPLPYIKIHEHVLFELPIKDELFEVSRTKQFRLCPLFDKF